MQIIYFGALGIAFLGVLGLRALSKAFGLINNAYENWLNKKLGIEVVIMPDGDFSEIVAYLMGVGVVGIAIYGILEEVFLCG